MNFYDDSDEVKEAATLFKTKKVVPRMLQPVDDGQLPEVDTRHAMPDDTMKVVVDDPVPRHPILAMQNAFAESMHDAGDPKIKYPTHDVKERRRLLLEGERMEDSLSPKWRQKPWQQHHQLWKLMAQISFGIYLLLNGMAKDDQQVMDILQTHVDEVDEFLEMTLEDFDLAQEDISERLQFLKLPLENISVFESMLEDSTFRTQIMEGNERISHVIDCTAYAVADSLKGVMQGMEATREFGVYLARLDGNSNWKQKHADMMKVFDAMKGNVDGWNKAYVALKDRGNNLGVTLVQLGTIVREIDQRAGPISHKIRHNKPEPEPHRIPSLGPAQMDGAYEPGPSKLSPITPEIRAPRSAYAVPQDNDPGPDEESEAMRYEPEPEVFILKPHTYTPTASSKPPQDPTEPPPVIQPKSSWRRFSLRKRDSSTGRQENEQFWNQYVVEGGMKSASPAKERNETATPNGFPTTYHPGRNINSNSNSSRDSSSTIQKPPSHMYNSSNGTVEHSITPDSAYYSESNKTHSMSPPPRPQPPKSTPSLARSPNQSPIPDQTYSIYSQASASSIRRQTPNQTNSSYSQASTTASFYHPTPRPPSNASTTIDRSLKHSHSFLPPNLTPMSDPHPFFRSMTPVQASPHSPLQRPWTAAGGSFHPGVGMSMSNGSTITSATTRGDRRYIPSAMGGSVWSATTNADTITREKRKEKKGKFGWLKKAFSLSEEEKAAFEARRRGAVDGVVGTRGQLGGDGERSVRWVDGRRVR